MSSNTGSSIEKMLPPSPTASQKRSINLFNAEEEEIDAISFERIGVNTMHYKDRTSIVSAKYADVTTCLGEIRPGRALSLFLQKFQLSMTQYQKSYLLMILWNGVLSILKKMKCIL